MAPTTGMLLKGLFFPSKRPFPFPPFPHDPKKGGGGGAAAAPPLLLPILGAPRPVRPLRASRTIGIPIEAKAVPIPLPTCLVLSYVHWLSLCVALESRDDSTEPACGDFYWVLERVVLQ